MRICFAALTALLAFGLGLVLSTGALAAGTPPVIESRSVYLEPGVTILEADIDPGGLETAYRFDLVFHEPCFDYSPPCEIPEELIPLPEGHLKASETAKHVSLDLRSAGLTLGPGTYEYALSATNSAGSARAPFEPFTPIAPGGETHPDAPVLDEPPVFSVPPPLPPAQPGPPAEPRVRHERKAAPCTRASRTTRHKRHRRHRRGIGRACSWG
ncbi:MAG TPA: hypothetical protein VFX35_07385 [Solirubrobacterales bacterium]|nr:hypothetical protein [Solirubrobacterales bacterium]